MHALFLTKNSGFFIFLQSHIDIDNHFQLYFFYDINNI